MEVKVEVIRALPRNGRGEMARVCTDGMGGSRMKKCGIETFGEMCLSNV